MSSCGPYRVTEHWCPTITWSRTRSEACGGRRWQWLRLEELERRQDGPDPLEVGATSPEVAGGIDGGHCDLDVGQRDGLTALS